MRYFKTELTPEIIAKEIKAVLIKNRETTSLNNVSELAAANRHSVCFFENKAYEKDLDDTDAGLIIVPADLDISFRKDTNFIKADHPYRLFNRIVKYWIAKDNKRNVDEKSATAKVAASAKLGKNVLLGEHVIIEANVTIGANTKIQHNCVVKENSVIGANCLFYPGVIVYANSVIKDNVIVHSNAVIGSDGFGYHHIDGSHDKIEHIGNVIIEDDVEIGANSAIDRGTVGSTVIGTGTKIDNLVQIAHNCKIGKFCIICAQVGIAGSTTIKDGVFLAGQVGIAGHLTIGQGAMIGAQSGVAGDVPDNARFFGTPAINALTQKRIIAASKQLPKLLKEYNKNIKRKNKDEGPKKND
jgi:UDP-3-O-[3-hydroxymyristoyl] glucosamine N-acyltransferase